jgi:hypothetical protein
LSACQQENDYKFHPASGDSGAYISLPQPEADPYGPCTSIASVCFKSMEEMVSDITTGTFTDKELEQIKWFPRSEDGRIPVVDLNNLLAPVYPDSCTLYEVEWFGRSYDFTFKTSSGKYIQMYYLDDEYEFETKKYTVGIYGSGDVISRRQEEKWDAKVIVTQDRYGCIHTFRFYQTNINGITYEFIEEEVKISDSVRTCTNVFFSIDATYYVYFRFGDRYEDYIDEFDSQFFSVVPYVIPNNDSNP